MNMVTSILSIKNYAKWSLGQGRLYLRLVIGDRDDCNRENKLNSSPYTRQSDEDLRPAGSLRELVNGKLLRGTWVLCWLILGVNLIGLKDGQIAGKTFLGVSVSTIPKEISI